MQCFYLVFEGEVPWAARLHIIQLCTLGSGADALLTISCGQVKGGRLEMRAAPRAGVPACGEGEIASLGRGAGRGREVA